MKNSFKNLDQTAVRNYLSKFQYLVEEYLLIKSGGSNKYSRVGDFYKVYNLERRNFLKYVNRYKQDKDILSLLPQKRGPKYKTRRPDLFIEQEVIGLRIKGINRYEIYHMLKPTLKEKTPSPSGVYNILKRYNLNKMPREELIEKKRKIIKERIGQLGHIDCHYLSTGIIEGKKTKLYVLCLLDDYSRVAWAEVIEKCASLDVMFATLKSLNILNDSYKIKFEEILSDNGSEFSSSSIVKSNHPFERLLVELGIKHRYIRPYRPQTNGKVERFWRTLEEDLLEGVTFNSMEELKEELLQYVYYYNHHRPHQGIDGKIPVNLLPN